MQTPPRAPNPQNEGIASPAANDLGSARDVELAAEWFDRPTSTPRLSSAPPPVAVVGEFLGDPLADAWLR